MIETALPQQPSREETWRQAINAAIAAVGAIPVGPPNPYDGPYQRGSRDGRAMALDAAMDALTSLAALSQPEPTDLGNEQAPNAALQEVCNVAPEGVARPPEPREFGF